MRAVVISSPGGPEVLDLREVSDPTFGPHEVVVRVHATAVNRADLLQRAGRYPAPEDCPADIPGLEFAGRIETCGGRVTTVRPGDRVMGVLGGGGYAEKVRVHEGLCMPIPPGVGWADAAAIPEVFLTAYDALITRGRLSAGEVVLVHAAGSGVGTAAIQIASISGARVLGLSRSPEKRRRLVRMGADRVFDPTDPDLVESIRLGAGGGIDVVLDLVGASQWAFNLDVLGTCGRLVLVGLMTGSRVDADLATLMAKRLTVVGTVLRSRRLEDKIALTRTFSHRMLPLFAAGRLRPVVDRTLPLSAVAEAHAVMHRNENLGKIVLEVERASEA